MSLKAVTEAEDEVALAETRLREATEALRVAKENRRDAEYEIAYAVAQAIIKSDLGARDFGEEVANAAREHGSDCGRRGFVETTPAWRRFRVLLAELVRRAEQGAE